MVKRKRKPMRMLIAVGIAITMLFAVVALSACNGGEYDTSDNNGVNNMIRVGFDGESSPENPYNSAIAFIVEGTEFAVGEDVIVRLYFGAPVRLYGHGSSARAEVSMQQVTGLFPDEVRHGDTIVLREIEDFTLEEYLFVYNPEQNLMPPLQTITIPFNWFVGERGVIGFRLTVFYIIDGIAQDPREGGRSLFYRVVDDKVQLSATRFQ